MGFTAAVPSYLSQSNAGKPQVHSFVHLSSSPALPSPPSYNTLTPAPLLLFLHSALGEPQFKTAEEEVVVAAAEEGIRPLTTLSAKARSGKSAAAAAAAEAVAAAGEEEEGKGVCGAGRTGEGGEAEGEEQAARTPSER